MAEDRVWMDTGVGDAAVVDGGIGILVKDVLAAANSNWKGQIVIDLATGWSWIAQRNFELDVLQVQRESAILFQLLKYQFSEK